MGNEEYKVQVLHFINPHLMWVLAEKEGEHKKYVFEQIGIYGISPLDVSIDMDCNVSTIRGQKWLPAVTLAMQNILLDAKEVWFSVAFVDRTTSIFDDNIHKYGDLILKMKDGRVVNLQRELLESSFVVDDVKNFHQNLETKLDYVNTLAVINNIKESLRSLTNKPIRRLEDILSKQTTVFQKTVELEETIAPWDLDLTNRNRHAQILLHKQMHDLNVCKDVDEESFGRASNIRTLDTFRKMSSALFRKLSLRSPQNEEEKEQLATDLEAIDNFLCEDGNKKQEIQAPTVKRNIYRGIPEKPKQNDQNKRFVNFGPAGLNTMQYRMKEVKEEEEQPKILVKIKNERAEVKDNPRDDMFDKADSEVNIKIDNMAILKSKMHLMNSLAANRNATNNDGENNKKPAKDNEDNSLPKNASSAMRLKMKILKEKMAKMEGSSSTADTDSTARQGDNSDSESNISALVDNLDVSDNSIKEKVRTEPEIIINNVKNNVDPFKNLEGNQSVFVEKLVRPTLMVHTKKGNRVQPVSNMRDIPFGVDIHIVLSNMSVKKPMRPQTVSWPTILRGHSLFLVSPYDSGKTIGYLPAVCRLVSDNRKCADGLSVARLTCIILCATANSVCTVEELCKMFLHEAHIFACYNGMDDLEITTSILNGCDILICTPCLLVRLIRDNFGLDFRNLNTFVIDDCERVSEVYQKELKFCLVKIKEMLKSRANKEAKVQYVVASRIWCSFMSSLAKTAPDSIVCIGAFQECVLYSEVATSVEFLKKESKVDAVVKFLNDIDKSKKTVIACRSDDEVHLIAKTLTKLKYVVFACDNTMTVQDLYSIDLALGDYKEPMLGPILVCCDGNLTHLNLTDAHYLIHFSLPETFSMFCKRFAVLIDNYPSIFENEESDVKIKIFLENGNVEQLPKILHFIKRCSDNIPPVLDEISAAVMAEKELKKAQSYVPLCNLFLSMGECPDIWNCKHRHAIFQEFDEPSAWIAREGVITFRILHYHSPVHYSARMISCTTSSGTKKFPQTYSMLSIKLGMYYSREINKKLHGIAKPGDICAVSLKHNLFARCQVMKILKYNHNNIPSLLLINLIDEEKYELAQDTCLYHLPDDLKKIESQAVKVILDGLLPQDRDITYSKIAEQHIKNVTEKNEEVYLRGPISLVIGNCIFVETIEACQELSSLNETVVKSNFKNELLNGYAIKNPDHINTLLKLGQHVDFMRKNEVKVPSVVQKPVKVLPKASWAHLESGTHVPVYYLYAKSPGVFFVQHVKFQDCLNILLKDIKKYVSENPEPVEDVKKGDIVLAYFPDDGAYERARIDEVIDGKKVKCFYVDLGDWRTISIDKLWSIPGKLISQLPFQAIECRLVGIKPLGDEWSEFSTNWLVDQFYDSSTNLKYLFAKRFTKEKAEYTDGDKYGICLIDTYADDVNVNKLMLDANLAEESEEIEFFEELNSTKENKTSYDNSRSTEDANTTQEEEIELENTEVKKTAIQEPSSTSNNILTAKTKGPSNATEALEIKTGGVTKSDDSSLEPSKESQIALKNAFHNTNDRGSPSSGSVSAEDDLRANQQKIMNLFRSNPLRSVPLVNDDDDTDDERWDSHNPMLMLTNPDGTPNKTKVTEISACTENTTNKSKLLAINDSKDKSDKETNSTTTPTKPDNVSIEKQNLTTTLETSTSLNTSVLSDTEQKEKSETKQERNILWSVSESDNTISLYDEKSTENDKALKLTWNQETNSVTIKILVKTEKYKVEIKDKSIIFSTKSNERIYGFEFELYGVVDTDKSAHSNKGTHVQVLLSKVMRRKWLKLYKGDIKKYDVCDECDDTSTDTSTVEENTSTGSVKDQSKVSLELPHATPVNKTQQINNYILSTPPDNLRKPKLVWRQNKYKVTIKIQIITEVYDLIIQERSLRFTSTANDENYGFEFELYGVIEVEKSCHTNKGQYIQVTLTKVMSKKWLTLNKGSPKKWIVYDVDNIDVSSEDEEKPTVDKESLQKCLNINNDTETEDEFDDDTNFPIRRY